jgi:hypothetical protein
MHAFVSAVGLFASGLGSWAEAQAVLTGRARYLERGSSAFRRLRLPANDLRRAGTTARLAPQVAQEALDSAGVSTEVPQSVFACSGGNTEALDKILASLDDPGRPVSPNQFAYVGHNAPAGLWCTMFASHAASTSLGSYDGSFAAGLVEAVAQAKEERIPVLLVVYDMEPPRALAPFRRVHGSFAASLLLTAESRACTLSRLHLEITRGRREDTLIDPGLEAMRKGNPAARCLPLLRLIAAQQDDRVVLPYLGREQLLVEHAPC